MAIKPTNVSFKESIATIGAITALPALKYDGKIKAGQKVLINGASGSVGTAAVQLAKYYEAKVTAVCSSRNYEFVKSLGADSIIDYTKQDFTKLATKYDLILNTVNNSTYAQSKDALKTEWNICIYCTLYFRYDAFYSKQIIREKKY